MDAHKLIFPLIYLLLMFGCTNESKSPKNPLKDSLNKKEQELLIREQQLDTKEKELLNREQRLDSLKNRMDTVGLYKPAIIGEWKVSMICKETTCDGYAVGDTKTESWKIAYINNKVIVSAYANKTLVRIYQGLFKTNGLELSAVPAPDAQTEISVLLTLNSGSESLIEGTRTIYKKDNCKVEFAVTAEKQ